MFLARGDPIVCIGCEESYETILLFASVAEAELWAHELTQKCGKKNPLPVIEIDSDGDPIDSKETFLEF